MLPGSPPLFDLSSVLVLYLPTLVAVVLLSGRIAARRARSRYPIEGSILRPVGESTRSKIETLTDRFHVLLLWIVVFPGLLAVASTLGGLPFGAGLGISVTAAAVFGYRLWLTHGCLSAYALGYDGERVTSHFLAVLERQGCRVFHDLPLGDRNLDHVVLAPGTLWAIETKTRRRLPEAGAGGGDLADYDGTRIRYPGGADAYGLSQARDNAKALACWLSSETGHDLRVEAVLALPGWRVRSSPGATSPRVHNPAELPQLILSAKGAGFERERYIQLLRLLETKAAFNLSAPATD